MSRYFKNKQTKHFSPDCDVDELYAMHNRRSDASVDASAAASADGVTGQGQFCTASNLLLSFLPLLLQLLLGLPHVLQLFLDG